MVPLSRPRLGILRVVQGPVPHRLDRDRIHIRKILDLPLAPDLAIRMRQPGQRDVLADATPLLSEMAHSRFILRLNMEAK